MESFCLQNIGLGKSYPGDVFRFYPLKDKQSQVSIALLILVSTGISVLLKQYIFFFLTFGTLWKLFMTCAKVTFQSKVIFWLYIGLWSLYGVFYQLNETYKMIGYNMLDLVAKAFVGIFFWLYLTKAVIF